MDDKRRRLRTRIETQLHKSEKKKAVVKMWLGNQGKHENILSQIPKGRSIQVLTNLKL